MNQQEQLKNIQTSGASWSREVIGLYEEGASDAEVAAHLRVPLKAFYARMNESTAFNDLIDFGRTLSKAFWEGLARRNVSNKSFNSSLYAFYMKNRHGWADKIETSGTSETVNYNVDEARQKAIEMIDKFIKKNSPELTEAQHVLTSLSQGVPNESPND